VQLLPFIALALAPFVLAGEPETPHGKQGMFGEKGPELFIENLPSTTNLLPPLPPQSRPALVAPETQPAPDTAQLNATAAGPQWTARGPFPIPNGQTEPADANGISQTQAPVSGRVTAISVHPTNVDVAYVGTAQGGLYRTLNGGGTWTQLMDNAPSTTIGTPLAIGAVMISPVNASTLFVGTGEGNLSGDSFFGSGFYIITNADTFNPIINGPYNSNGMGGDVFTGRSIVAIAVDPTNENNIFVSTSSGIGGIRSSAYSVRPPRGLYRSMNAMAGVNGTGTPAFTRLQVTGTTSGDTISTSVVMEPANPNNLYVSFLGQAAADPAGIYRSANALDPVPVFVQMKATPLGAANGNAKLAASKPAGGLLTVYATTSEGGTSTQGSLFKSVNNGAFVQLPGVNGFAGGQGFYDIAVGVDPTDANNVSVGGNVGQNIYRYSRNGGATFASSVNTLHADVHAIAYAPSNPNVIYHGNDGGIWRSLDAGLTWIALNNAGFSATQFSDIATHPVDPNFTLAGTQDNGTELLLPDGTFRRVDFGDGGFTLIDRNATNTTAVTMYHTYFNSRTALLGTGRVLNVPCAIEGEWAFRGAAVGALPNTPLRLSGTVCDGSEAFALNGISITDNVNFYAPMVLGPGNPNTWYYGSDKLYRSSDRADTAVAVSQLFDQQLPPVGGTPPQPTAISTIAVAPQDDNVRLVGLNNGEVFATTTGAPVLLQIAGPGATNGPGDTPATANVTSGASIGVGRIRVDPNNKNIAYVAYTGFGTPAAPIAHLYKVTNLNNLPTGNVTFTPMSTGLPDVPHNAIAIDPASVSNGASAHIYVGTDAGVYASFDAGATWAPYGNGFPHVSVFGLEIQSPSRTLRAATHGRGIYDIPVAFQPGLKVLSAVSRKGHGSVGSFDVNLPLTGSPGVEPRSGGTSGDYQVVVTFAGATSVAGATVTSGTGTVSSFTVSGSTVTVNLTGVTSPQIVTIKLAGVNDGTTTADLSIPMGVVVGDTNGDGTVNSGDSQQTRNRSGQITNATNFRSDVNTDGTVNSGDSFIVRSRSGQGITL